MILSKNTYLQSLLLSPDLEKIVFTQRQILLLLWEIFIWVLHTRWAALTFWIFAFAEVNFIFRIFFLVITLILQVKSMMWGKYWLWTLKGELYKLLFPLGYLLYAWRQNTVSDLLSDLLPGQTDITYLTACSNSHGKFINFLNFSCLLLSLAHLPASKAAFLWCSSDSCHFLCFFSDVRVLLCHAAW